MLLETLTAITLYCTGIEKDDHSIDTVKQCVELASITFNLRSVEDFNKYNHKIQTKILTDYNANKLFEADVLTEILPQIK